MTSLKEKFDLEELFSILFGMFLSGTIIMWFFYTTFPPWIPPWDPETTVHLGNMIYLSLAIIFTISTVVSFVLIWWRKKKA